MKKPSRFLRVLGAAGLMISLLAATIAPVGAQDQDDFDDLIDDLLELNDGSFADGNNAIFYPWVANGDDFGLGESQTSISVQNLEGFNGAIAIFVGDGDGGFTLETTAFLSAFAAKTFHADDLGIEEGSGAPVAVVGFGEFDFAGTPDDDFPDLTPGSALVETPVILSKPVGVEGDFTQVIACVINDGAGNPVGFAIAAEFDFEGETFTPGTADEPNYFVGAFTQADLQAILEDAQDDGDDDDTLVNPFGGLNNDGDCSDEGIAGTIGGEFLAGLTIAGVAKQAVTGDNLPTTTAADTAVSGYNAINGAELSQFDEFYLPIVQTNCGPGGCWDTVIRVANLAGENNAVTIRFFPADDGSGSLATGFQIQESVDGGSTVNINLGDLVPEGWVGSAHILSDGGVFAMADRYKVGYNMWITNTGSGANFENEAQIENAMGNYVLFAP
ncbi:MAG: hypothetical protein H0V47_15615, partial [Chloroflexia bacterium]|nr:hypothetical protein [Chloroflexia bacterium]